MQQNLKYPRLYAALAVTGLLSSAAAVANDKPLCKSSSTSFGGYDVTTEYHDAAQGTGGEFRVTLERFYMKNTSRVEALIDDGNIEKVLDDSWITIVMAYRKASGSNNYSPYVTNTYVAHPGMWDNDSKIIGAALTVTNNKVYPSYIDMHPQEDLVASYFHTDVGADVFRSWRSNGDVRVTLYAHRNDQEVPYAVINLPADKISEFDAARTQQMNMLTQRYENNDCQRYSRRSSGQDDCFLTTAATACIGLADDCWELSILREFRDEYLLKTVAGTELVSEYYAIAPNIVRQVNTQTDAQQRWLHTYWNGILPTAILVRLGMHRLAEYSYRRMVKRLQASLVA